MTQHTVTPDLPAISLRDLAADTSISSRALAFVYMMSLMAKGKPTMTATRREVEIETGMQHKTWPEAEAKALGTYLPPEHRGSNRYTDGHGEAGTWAVRQFDPIRVSARISASRLNTTATSGSVLDTERTLSVDDGVELSHPSDLVWDVFGQQRSDTWRMYILAGRRDVLVTAADLTWLDRRTAQRFLARARAAHLLVDGMWMGTNVATLIENLTTTSPRTDRIRDRARKEVSANDEKMRLLMDRHSRLNKMLELWQPEYLALALERGSECAIEWAKEMGDPELRRAFAYGGQSQPEVVAW